MYSTVRNSAFSLRSRHHDALTLLGRRAVRRAQVAPEVDAALVTELEGMGFGANRAVRAIYNTGGAGARRVSVWRGAQVASAGPRGLDASALWQCRVRGGGGATLRRRGGGGQLADGARGRRRPGHALARQQGELSTSKGVGWGVCGPLGQGAGNELDTPLLVSKVRQGRWVRVPPWGALPGAALVPLGVSQ